jgi:hypothetical protein
MSRSHDYIVPSKGGAAITTSGTSARVAVPNASNGVRPRYVRIAASAAALVRTGDSSVTAVTTDTLVQPGDPVILALLGDTHVAAIQLSAAGTVQVQPLDE